MVLMRLPLMTMGRLAPAGPLAWAASTIPQAVKHYASLSRRGSLKISAGGHWRRLPG